MLDRLLYSRILPYSAWLIYSLLKCTWKVSVLESESFKLALANQSPLVFAHWHGDIPGILYLLPRYNAAPMISKSKDGEIIARVVELLGSKTSRGSSHRGGVSALKGILSLSKQGFRPVVAVDGPKGPRHIVKPGVFEVSRVLGAQIVPLAMACNRYFVFKNAWDKTILPKPFAHIQVVWGETMPSVPRDGDAREKTRSEELEKGLLYAGQHARNLLLPQ